MEHAHSLPLIHQALHQGELSLCEKLLHQAFQGNPKPSPELIHLSALWHHSCGRNHHALQILRALLQSIRQLPHFIWNDLGSLYAQCGQPNLAEQCFKHALSQAPHILIYAFNFAKSLHDQKLYQKAAGVYMELLKRDLDQKEYLLSAIETFVAMGKITQAEKLLKSLNSSDIEYITAKCLILKSLGSSQQALDYLQKRTNNSLNKTELQSLIGFYARESAQYEIAQATYLNLSKTQPEVLEWPVMIGVCLIDQKQYTTAEKHFQKLIKSQPDQPEILLHLGDLYNKLNRPLKAVEYWTKYISLIPYNTEVLYNLGNLYASQKNYADAVRKFKEAIAYQPDFLDAWINLTLSHYEHREYAAAEQAAYQAVQLSPENPRAHIGYGDALLMQEKYKEGFNEIEWRFAEKNYQMFKYPAPPWKGEELNNQHILVLSEQGLGDIIMLSRFIFELQDRHPQAKISFRCRPELISLFTHWPFDIYTDGQKVENVDYAVALMSLLKILNIDPNRLPPPHHLNNIKIAKNMLHKEAPPHFPRIGLVWSSGKGLTQSKRSIDPQLFIPLIEKNPHCHFYGLQKDQAKNSIFAELPNYTDLSNFLHDFSHTAAYCKSLDLIISVDTSVAHLAGSLNVPTWVLLPFSPDWRWGAESSSSSWYPSAYLIRQKSINGWPETLCFITEKLGQKYPYFPTEY